MIRKRAHRETETHGRTIVFPIDVLDALQPHATRRRLHVNELVRRIIEQVADENMVDAVLDDAAPDVGAVRADLQHIGGTG